jgi:hypothetical protein
MIAQPDPITEHAAFFEEHAISLEVARARPYCRWTPDDQSVVRDAYEGLGPKRCAWMLAQAAQRHDHATNPFYRRDPTALRKHIAVYHDGAVVIGKHRHGGWVMTRYPPPGLDLSHVFAEIRPDRPIRRKSIRHFHGPEGTVPTRWVAPWRIYRPEELRRHIQRHADHGNDKSKDIEPWADERLAEVNDLDVHIHHREAKYLQPPRQNIDQQFWLHNHMNRYWPSRPEKLAKHLEQYVHEDPTGDHVHIRNGKDPDDILAKRLDVHPLAVDRIVRDDVVFFAIEGVLKSDAILTAGAAVFCVPSVTLWDAPELKDFVDRYLWGRTVVIVPDADWFENPLVESQARICSSALLRHGVGAVHVAAPPVDLETGKPRAGQGIDDFLAGGGRLADLMTFDRVVDRDAIRRFVLRNGGWYDRIQSITRNTKVLYSMALWAGSGGLLDLSQRSMAKVMGIERKSVERTIEEFGAIGAIRVIGDTSTRDGIDTRRGYVHSEDWEHRPLIYLAAPELRARDMAFHRLRDVLTVELAA